MFTSAKRGAGLDRRGEVSMLMRQEAMEAARVEHGVDPLRRRPSPILVPAAAKDDGQFLLRGAPQHLAPFRRRTGSRRRSDPARLPSFREPAASTGCARYGPGTSPQSLGVGNTLPGLHSPFGSKAPRTRCINARSSAVNIVGMY